MTSTSVLLERLAQRTLIADGAMGTMLQAAGRQGGECGELWNLTQPDKIRAIHTAYLEAGSDIVLTNTFGGTCSRLREYGEEGRVREINRAAARLARQAADPFGAIVLGDIGPSGEMMEPYGEVPEEEMIAAFSEQAEGLVEGGVDALIVETMTAANEMAAALDAAVQAADGIPVIASFSLQKTGGAYRTMMGETVAQCTEIAIAHGAAIVGCNCGLGIGEMIEVVREMRAATDRPIIAQPNAGLPELVAGAIIYRQTPAMMADKVPLLVEAGASIVGGCCGTNPDFIRLVREKVGTE